jgi:hypothetical protein
MDDTGQMELGVIQEESWHRESTKLLILKKTRLA